MKLNIYLNRLVRNIEKKIGKKDTMKILGISRWTLGRWQKGSYGNNIDNLEHVSRKYAEVYSDVDPKEIFMQGLVCILEDRFKEKV